MIEVQLNSMHRGRQSNGRHQRLVYFGGIYDLIHQDKELSDHSFQFFSKILPSGRQQPAGYDILVPTLTGDIDHSDLLRAMLPESAPASFFADMARQVFDAGAVHGKSAAEKYEHYKSIAGSTVLVGYCYGSFTAQKVMDEFELHMSKEGLNKKQVASVMKQLKAVHIAPITPVPETSDAAQLYFLQLNDTVAATYMDKDIIRRALASPEKVEHMTRCSADAVSGFDPQSNPNNRHHKAEKQLSVYRQDNSLLITSASPAQQGVGYYNIGSGSEDKRHAGEKTYHPNCHGIRGYVLSNRFIPGQGAIALAQNGFSVMLPPLLKTLLLQPEKITGIQDMHDQFFTDEKLEKAGKSLHAARKLRDYVEKTFTVDPYGRS
jgi:hypothetical protein